MVKLNKIYTRTGDDGTTGLVDGSRVSKADPRMAAIGDVDEANSAIGVALVAIPAGPVRDELALIQNDLFDLGADLATPIGIEGALRVIPAQATRLERAIDALNDHLSPLTSFILPGGDAGAASLHLARAIVRRAERSVAAVGAAISPSAATYINRLSDYLFVAARALNQNGAGDVLWVPGGTR
ncbi:cob(I)yrinic acid a c-diamide adenosyltransferase [Sphingomonas sp. Leaf339]|uniref:cob(I)yrinic acid a,c-diamide adenosyltransferase n=1 Tax=Sphingomonas sp. Leaf339 TaxID=1736343 RepID=UPI0006FCAC97|nr:cob(I)yrinic acid a,c-diamide adenosyltransferase [Sphingomonas sp. Leaf339]KQU45181.1 cob(I)yrinic acid a c-diamide adenosyltransferase [Sphingomonas sp. Leaf339]